MNIIEVKNLKTSFRGKRALIPVVDGVSFHVKEKEVLGIVGESGCGKSVTSLSIMGLISPALGLVEGGEIRFHGEDLLKKSEAEMRKIRGNRISMIFQEPMTALNPFYTCGEQIAESLRLHLRMNRKQAKERAIELLRLVNIPFPEQRAKEHPHRLSGGMRQRVLIAMAIACNPELLIADEPTTALDVTIQSQILELLKRLRSEMGMSVIFITHDLGVIADVTERVAVMYAGKIVEQAATKELLSEPLHPYTQGLIKAVPQLHGEKKRLHSIEGSVPVPGQELAGCRFCERCPQAREACREKEPPLTEVRPGRSVACWLYSD